MGLSAAAASKTTLIWNSKNEKRHYNLILDKYLYLYELNINIQQIRLIRGFGFISTFLLNTPTV